MLPWYLNGILIGVTLVMIVSLHWIFSFQSPYVCERGDDQRMLQMLTLFSGMFLWPVVWYALIGFQVFDKYPALVIAFLWPVLMTFYQVMDERYDQEEDLRDTVGRRNNHMAAVKTESSALISTAFAMGGMFMVLSRLNNDNNVLQSSSYLVIIALLICISLMIPASNSFINSQRYTHIFRNVQRVALNYAMGLIMASLIIVVSSNRPNIF